MKDSPRFEAAVYLFEYSDSEDPRPGAQPDVTRTLQFHRSLAGWIDALAPDASEELRLAGRCLHIRRWMIDRRAYASGVEGYRTWRARLRPHHAGEAAGLLRGVGYSKAEIDRVKDLVQKLYLGSDPETQILEDAACLAAIEVELVVLLNDHPAAKVESIVERIWAKMSPPGRALVVDATANLPLPVAELVREATGGLRGGT